MSSTDSSTRRAILAVQLYRLAAEYAVGSDAPYAQQLELLARQAASDPTAILSPTLDHIIDLAENPCANFSTFTAIQLDDAALRVKARRDAVAKSDFHTMLRLNKIYWILHNEVARRTGGIMAPTARHIPTYAEDYNTTRRRRRGGRW